MLTIKQFENRVNMRIGALCRDGDAEALKRNLDLLEDPNVPVVNLRVRYWAESAARRGNIEVVDVLFARFGESVEGFYSEHLSFADVLYNACLGHYSGGRYPRKDQVAIAKACAARMGDKALALQIQEEARKHSAHWR